MYRRVTVCSGVRSVFQEGTLARGAIFKDRRGVRLLPVALLSLSRVFRGIVVFTGVGIVLGRLLAACGRTWRRTGGS